MERYVRNLLSKIAKSGIPKGYCGYPVKQIEQCLSKLEPELESNQKDSMQISMIYDEMRTEHTVRCSNCGIKAHYYNYTALEAATLFYNNNWRAGKGHLYCPRCAEVNGELDELKDN